MSKDIIAEEVVEEEAQTPVVEEAPKKPKRQEPKYNIEIGAASATVEVPLDCGDKPQTDVLIGQIGAAKALAISKARTIIKAVRNSKTKAVETRPVFDLVEKKLVVEVTFEPAIAENFVKVAQEAV